MKNSLPIKFVPKGWGFEKWIVNCEEYCGKLLYFAKDKRCSWHYHVLKDEVFYVQSGRLLVKFSEDNDLQQASSIELGPGDNFHVYRGLRHQMLALEDTELLISNSSEKFNRIEDKSVKNHYYRTYLVK